jgi:hypothetical protein
MSKKRSELSGFCREVSNLLRDENRWTTGTYARRGDGSECHPGNQNAKAWGLDGAIEAVEAPLWAKSELEESIRFFLGKEAITRFNDRATHQEVRAVLAKAVVRAQERFPKLQCG